MCKVGWKKLIQTQINEYWKSRLISDCELYSSLKYLDYSSFTPNRCHWNIHIDNESNPSWEAMLIATKLKLATCSYILQQKRAKFIHNEKPTCKLCDAEDEDVEHFIFRCVCLQPIRSSYINDLSVIFHEATAKEFLELPSINQIQIIMDCTSELKFHKDNVWPKKSDMDYIGRIHKLTRRLCFDLHTARTRLLNIKRK